MATAEQKQSYISMCASIIRDNYSGDPLSLDSFIDKIDLIKELTDDNLRSTFFAFVKSKLEGKARESLPESARTVEDILGALKQRIKPESSKVVSGRIAAMQIKGDNYVEFSKQVEDLADAFERSLIVEGITKTKAHEMAVEQTVNVCRQNARSNLVKSIIASTTFTEPKDVIAKLIVEQSVEANERQVLTFNSHRENRNFSFNNNNNNRFGTSTFNRGANYRRRGSWQFNNGSHNYSNRGRNFFNRGNRGNNSQHPNQYRAGSRSARTLPLNAEVPQQTLTLGEQTLN